MSLKLDRNILQWFDYFFEEQKTFFQESNFICKLYRIEEKGRQKTILTLEKDNPKYWKIYFEMPQELVVILEENVHPIFREYICEQISIYNNNRIYNFINANLIGIFDTIAFYSYNQNLGAYTVNFRNSFLEKCRNLKVDEDRKIGRDLYLNAESNEKFKFFNDDRTFAMSLKFDIAKEENLLDSLIDLRKSIIISDKS
ncbi:hypothetical protein [Peptacetobacter sp.]|uniref:hypothetical protein n=1 Tax=Peptacetobacter sp. TaxID=2991975 RepID=UPI00263A32E1|nr:hypothetical protein [Peptacetobacter sp.]